MNNQESVLPMVHTEDVKAAKRGTGSALIAAGVIAIGLAIGLVYIGGLGAQQASNIGAFDARRGQMPLLAVVGRDIEPPAGWASGVSILTIVIGAISLISYVIGGMMKTYAFLGILLALAMLIVGAVALSRHRSHSLNRSGWLQAASGLWIVFVILQFGFVGAGMTIAGARLLGQGNS